MSSDRAREAVLPNFKKLKEFFANTQCPACQSRYGEILSSFISADVAYDVYLQDIQFSDKFVKLARKELKRFHRCQKEMIRILKQHHISNHDVTSYSFQSWI